MSESTEEHQQIDNYTDYINEMKEEFSQQMENCIESYSGINNTITYIGQTYPNMDKNLFAEFFGILETFFSLLSNTNDILCNFATLNDKSQKNEEIFYLKLEEINALKNQNKTLADENISKTYCLKKYEEEVASLRKENNSLRLSTTDRTKNTEKKI